MELLLLTWPLVNPNIVMWHVTVKDFRHDPNTVTDFSTKET